MFTVVTVTLSYVYVLCNVFVCVNQRAHELDTKYFSALGQRVTDRSNVQEM